MGLPYCSERNLVSLPEPDPMSAAVPGVGSGAAGQVHLAARICRPKAAGTVFALLMAVSNLAILTSTWLGSIWYDQLDALWGHRAAFNALVAMGAGFTAGCWLLAPWLRPAARTDSERGA
jgi:predicted MFS family arabinose efflux permease